MQEKVAGMKNVSPHPLASEHTLDKRLQRKTLEELIKTTWDMLGYVEECSVEHFEEHLNRGSVAPIGGFETAFVRLPEDTHFVCIFADFFSSASNGGAIYLRCGIAPWGDLEARRTLALMPAESSEVCP
ncbi:MAG: hypothetical protein H8D63_00165 [Parcubacteria group bacterium]|nr:hypothetical protein [Parcubacteria group bacterium]